ncbi:MAG TPA: rhodanese-like domain-containing protein [Bacteroidales bacterium]|jgi:rhodanese-related sulfurtransferase|nr:rhodanese-like domain-containing protein [Bacteroidales bacterium]MCZ2417117.1 rhodanese-like domain-containing protein [Burkholderiales bacterium]OQC58283.1 MAG: Thiosulfate sulfurtransferase PspE precursor [Bacteroidetes bacterium ADurb.Bin013]MBP8998892.1 rhodanese-like domain-containing protein [Bacteroidales bacterium]MBV6456053.1 Thiosulfate sulfurtransferase GlpE [Bacteroidales bacterium]
MQRLFLSLLFLMSVMTLRAQVYDLEPGIFLQMIEANPHAQVLDLRDPLEFEYRHIPGAVNIQPASVYFLEEVRNQLSASDTLYIYCRMGKSTKEVTQLLLDNGYRVIFNLRGGSVAWDAHLDKERRRKKR